MRGCDTHHPTLQERRKPRSTNATYASAAIRSQHRPDRKPKPAPRPARPIPPPPARAPSRLAPLLHGNTYT
ncbi:hypothetical protein [Lysobacter gummosus]|uniref:hypothetical protein n=1 Tax=Lysobacter gummosus TaxID=262324 RepID=UPI00362DDABC